jgi:hypothetical protein
VTDDDIGLKVLREPPADADQIIEFVLFHGAYCPRYTKTAPVSSLSMVSAPIRTIAGARMLAQR